MTTILEIKFFPDFDILYWDEGSIQGRSGANAKEEKENIPPATPKTETGKEKYPFLSFTLVVVAKKRAFR